MLAVVLIWGCKTASSGYAVADSGATSDAEPTQPPTIVLTPVADDEIEIMSYNIENLYDTEHDPAIDDWEFTPKGTPGKAEHCATISNPTKQTACLASDWTPTKLAIKLNNLERIIRHSDGTTPDILGVIEVENEKVVRELAAKLGYEGVAVTESRDKRGIDLAILYRPSEKLQFISQTAHRPSDPRFEQYPTRDILEVEFQVASQHRLSVFVNHWPSQRTSPKARLAIAAQLHELLEQRLSVNGKHHFVFMGDFNTSPSDDPHPFRETWLRKGTAVKMFDVHERFQRSRNVNGELKRSLAPGSAFYIPQMRWSLLDRFFVSTNLRDSRDLEVDVTSYRIYTPASAQTTYTYPEGSYMAGSQIVGAPHRHNSETTDSSLAGASDHFPIIVKLKY